MSLSSRQTNDLFRGWLVHCFSRDHSFWDYIATFPITSRGLVVYLTHSITSIRDLTWSNSTTYYCHPWRAVLLIFKEVRVCRRQSDEDLTHSRVWKRPCRITQLIYIARYFFILTSTFICCCNLSQKCRPNTYWCWNHVDGTCWSSWASRIAIPHVCCSQASQQW